MAFDIKEISDTPAVNAAGSAFPIFGAAMTLANVAHGLWSQNKAEKGLASLIKPQGYAITPELQNSYGRAEQMAKTGYTGQEVAAFQNNLSTQNNTSYNKAMAYGGSGLSGAIQAGINYGNNKALGDFASRDAALQRQNIHYADQRGDAITQQTNRQTGLANQQYQQQAQAYGSAIKNQKENTWGALNLFAATNPYLLNAKGNNSGSPLVKSSYGTSIQDLNGGGNGNADYNPNDSLAGEQEQYNESLTSEPLSVKVQGR